MASFSFSQTKIALTVGAMLGLSILTASVVGLNPNQVTSTPNGYQKPAPMSSLLEGCGHFYWFDEDLIKLTNEDPEKGLGTVIPVEPRNPNVEPLTEEMFRYYPLSEIKEIPSIDELLVTSQHYGGYIIWYMPSTSNDLIEAAARKADETGEKVAIVPWVGGYGGKSRLAIPQARSFAFVSPNQVTQTCNFVDPYSFTNFLNFSKELNS